MFRDEVRDKQVCDMLLMIMAYCELLYQDSLSLLEIHQEWLIDGSLAIIYLLTIFTLEIIVKMIAIFLIRSLDIQIFYEF